jgi:osmoprotectant transport system permease protein
LITDAAWARAVAMLPDRMAAHLGVSAAALGLALLIAAPLVLAMASRPRLRAAVLAAAAVIQTIPALALLALFYPLLLALSALTTRLIGVGVPSLGFLPSLLALALYALLPLLRGGADGLASVPPATLDAADGIGMTRRQRLLHVELPISAPIIMGGLRTAAVWTIGGATLATTVGQRSLGDLIFAGLQLEDWALVVTGCLAAAALAILTDMALWRVESGLATRNWRKASLGAAILVAMVAAVLALWWTARPLETTEKPIVVGAKSFAEQYILAELLAQHLRAQGYPVTIRAGLGSAVAFRALKAGEIDVYVDYSGTLWKNALARTDTPPRQTMLATLKTELPRQHNITIAANLGFENAYALAMKTPRAQALGIKTLKDLAQKSPTLRLATDTEFQQREEWTALQRTYNLRFARLTAYTPTLMVRALTSDEADVITAFSTDGRIAAENLTLLTDPSGALPTYDALILLGPNHQHLRTTLATFENKIPPSLMQQANYQADRTTDKQTPKQAAAWLAQAMAE